jgi:acetate kinase
LGIELDEQLNQQVNGESQIERDGSPTQIWVVPTNEELIVARQTQQLLRG